MRIRSPLIFFSIFLVSLSANQPVFAHGGGGRWHGGSWGGGGRVGIYIGAPVGFNISYSPFPYYRTPYYRPSFYAPAPVYYPPVQQSAQIIYTERRVEQPITSASSPINSAQSVQNSWWYYCAASKAYYPYISKCSEGWLRVASQPELDK